MKWPTLVEKMEKKRTLFMLQLLLFTRTVVGEATDVDHRASPGLREKIKKAKKT